MKRFEAAEMLTTKKSFKLILLVGLEETVSKEAVYHGCRQM